MDAPAQLVVDAEPRLIRAPWPTTRPPSACFSAARSSRARPSRWWARRPTARRLVDGRRHGGTISVETAVGRGSTFTVSLPMMAGAGDFDDTEDDAGIKDLVLHALPRGAR